MHVAGLEVSIDHNPTTGEMLVREGMTTHHFHESEPLEAWFKALDISHKTGRIIQIRNMNVGVNIQTALLAKGRGRSNMHPLSTTNMAAECVTRDAKGRVTTTASIAIPAGLTHDEAVTFVRRWNQHEIAQFVTYSA